MLQLTQRHGDSKTHSIPLRWEGSAFAPDNLWNLVFSVKSSPETQTDDEAEFQKATGGGGITVSGSTAAVAILPTDTKGDPDADPVIPGVDPGTYYWSIRATNSQGVTRTVAEGTFEVIRDVTRESSPSQQIYTVSPPLLYFSYQDYLGTTTDDPPLTEAEWIQFVITDRVVVPNPAEGDMIQRVGGSWVARTLNQIKTALGLGSAAYTASTDYATAAQGALANTALQPGDVAFNDLTGTLDVLPFTTTNGGPQNQGELAWTQADETLSLQLAHGTILQLGEETLYHVENVTGSTIANGTPVSYAGTVGNSGKMRVKPWNGATDDPLIFMGVATSDIDTDDSGYVTHFGKVRGINTNAYTAGSVLYANPSGTGLTMTQPTGGQYVIAAVCISSANNGTLFVRPTRYGGANWDAIGGKPSTFTPSAHTHPASEISDSTATGRALITATDAADARTELGLGDAAIATTSTGGNGSSDSGKVAEYSVDGSLQVSVSIGFQGEFYAGNIVAPTSSSSSVYLPSANGTLALTSNTSGQVQWSEIGSTPSTFTPSAHTHPASEISDSTATGRSLMTAADAAAARTELGLGDASLATTSTGGNGATDAGKVSVFDAAGRITGYGVTVTAGSFIHQKTSSGTSKVTVSAASLSGAYTVSWANNSGTLALTASSTGVPDNISPPLEKTTPVDADETVLRDSAASYVAKRLTFANLWAWILIKLNAGLTIGGAKIWTGNSSFTASIVSFTSSTRPTSSGTGSPASNSLVTLNDVDSRGGRTVSAILGSDESGPTNSSTLTDSVTLALTLEAGTWDIEALIAVSCVSTSAGSKQKLNWSGTSSSFAGGLYQIANGAVNATTWPTTRQPGVAIDALRSSNNESLTTYRLGRLVATSTGVLSVQFASAVATSGIASSLVATSYIRAHKKP